MRYIAHGADKSSARLGLGFALMLLATFFSGAPARADTPQMEQVILRCQMEGSSREATIALAGTQAIYRFGTPGQAPELTLRERLMDLDYRRARGIGSTIDETITFRNHDTFYRFTTGFRDKLQPDPTAYHRFGHVTVSRAGKILAKLVCREATIERIPEKLTQVMIAEGRKTDSTGETFPNYTIQYPAPARQSPPCEQTFNVDSCWSRGAEMERSGDLAAALGHYDMSCAAKFNTAGCYDAGKFYLHNRQLRNYARAQDRFTRACDGTDPGEGPYACKYLGWMALTGTGMPRDYDKAWSLLARACFLHNDVLMIDAEGCHFFAQTALEKYGQAPKHRDMANYAAYIALAMGCSDNAQTVCAEGRALYQREAARNARWLKQCAKDASDRSTQFSCAALIEYDKNYDVSQAKRRVLNSLFLRAIDS